MQEMNDFSIECLSIKHNIDLSGWLVCGPSQYANIYAVLPFIRQEINQLRFPTANFSHGAMRC